MMALIQVSFSSLTDRTHRVVCVRSYCNGPVLVLFGAEPRDHLGHLTPEPLVNPL